MIKLTQHQPHDRDEIRVEGRLDADGLKSFQDLIGASPAIGTVVDLSGLTSVDRDSRAFLIALRKAGCRLLGGSLYINRLLEEV